MPIRATFLQGQTEISVNGLHQWDYGQQLEIQANDLPALVEVHFACAGMKEAVVRSCAVVNGVATAVIPDQCLEQETPIYAWVFVINGTTGATTKTAILHVTPRTKPQYSETVPTDFTDKYTELVSAVNEQIGALTDGSVTAARAIQAEHAELAESAGVAEIADMAHEAYISHGVHQDGTPVFLPPNFATQIRDPGYYYAEIQVTDAMEIRPLGLFYFPGSGLVVDTIIHAGEYELTISNTGSVSLLRNGTTPIWGELVQISKVWRD